MRLAKPISVSSNFRCSDIKHFAFANVSAHPRSSSVCTHGMFSATGTATAQRQNLDTTFAAQAQAQGVIFSAATVSTTTAQPRSLDSSCSCARCCISVYRSRRFVAVPIFIFCLASVPLACVTNA